MLVDLAVYEHVGDNEEECCRLQGECLIGRRKSLLDMLQGRYLLEQERANNKAVRFSRVGAFDGPNFLDVLLVESLARDVQGVGPVEGA